MSPGTPASLLERQFRNLTDTRRHIYSLLPLRRAACIVEPGCGGFLVARELSVLTPARLVCIDRVERTSPPQGCVFIPGDATRIIPSADIYVSSFFLYQLGDPVAYLKKVRRALGGSGFYAVAGEFAYSGDDPAVAAIAASLGKEGFDPAVRLASCRCVLGGRLQDPRMGGRGAASRGDRPRVRKDAAR